MMKKTIGCLGAASALALGVLAAPTAASATTPVPTSITFTGEAPGSKPNGYASAEFPGVHFSSTATTTVSVADFSAQTHGLGVVAFGTNGALEMRLTSPTTALSLAFGNDDPFIVDGTDQAQLTLFRGEPARSARST